jgi:hypothetical protein
VAIVCAPQDGEFRPEAQIDRGSSDLLRINKRCNYDRPTYHAADYFGVGQNGAFSVEQILPRSLQKELVYLHGLQRYLELMVKLL